MSNTYRVTPQVKPSAPAAPMAPASSPSAPYSMREHRRQQPRARAERAEDRGLVDALELRHRDGADQDQHAAEQRDPADDRDAEHRVVDDRLDARENLADVDRRDVRVARDEVVLQPGARGGVGRAPCMKPMKVCGACVERARTEHEHEPAAAGVPPLDAAGRSSPARASIAARARRSASCRRRWMLKRS